MASVQQALAAGPHKGLGRAPSLAMDAVRDRAVLEQLIQCLNDPKKVVVARAANALKKVQASAPRALDKYGREMLQAAATCVVLEARWNLLTLLGRLSLTDKQGQAVHVVLVEALRSVSAFERVSALQALADRAGGDSGAEHRLKSYLHGALEDPSAAVRARARRLLAGLHRS